MALRKFFMTIGGLLFITVSMSQKVGINTNTPQAALDVKSTTMGALLPRLTSAQRDAMTNVVEGTLIYNLTLHCLQVFNGFTWGCTDGSNKEGVGFSLFAGLPTTVACSSFDKTAANGFVLGGLVKWTSTFVDPFTFLTTTTTNTDAMVQNLDSAGNQNWLVRLPQFGKISAVQEINTGGFVAVGAKNPGTNTADATAIKLNANGDTLWTKTYGGSSADQFNSVAVMPDGHFIAVGFTYSNNGNVSGNHGGSDIWIVKLDAANGNIIWQTCLGGTGTDDAKCIKALDGGNFLVVGNSDSDNGNFTGNHGNSTDACVIKCYETFAGAVPFFAQLIGGSQPDYFLSADTTADGAYIIAGKTASNDGNVAGLHNGSALYNPWILKIDPVFGNTIYWQKCINSNSPGTLDDEAVSVKLAKDNGYIAALTSTHFATKYGGTDFTLVKYTASGTQSWATTMGGSGDELTVGVVQNNGGNYVVAGSSTIADLNIANPGYSLFKFGPTGVLKKFK